MKSSIELMEQLCDRRSCDVQRLFCRFNLAIVTNGDYLCHRPACTGVFCWALAFSSAVSSSSLRARTEISRSKDGITDQSNLQDLKLDPPH